MANVMAPSDKTRYLQPQLFALVQVDASSQEKLGIKAQASRLAIRFPTDQNTARELKRLPEVKGRNSKKTAASTGRFPPTPTPKHAYSAQALVSTYVRSGQIKSWKGKPKRKVKSNDKTLDIPNPI